MKDVVDLEIANLNQDFLSSCATHVVYEFRKRREQTSSPADKVAKSKEFVGSVKRRLAEEIQS